MPNIDVTTVIDGVPYTLKAEPFDFNFEKRFNVSYGGRNYVFAYDETMGKYTALGEDAVDIPDNVESLIAERLERYR